MHSLHLNFISSVCNGNVCHSSELEKNKEFNNNYAKSINNKYFILIQLELISQETEQELLNVNCMQLHATPITLPCICIEIFTEYPKNLKIYFIG